MKFLREPKKDCISYRLDHKKQKPQCDCLKEMLCMTMGRCPFYCRCANIVSDRVLSKDAQLHLALAESK